MHRRLVLDVTDPDAFARDVGEVLFVPAPGGFPLGERLSLEARFADGSTVALAVTVLASRQHHSRSEPAGVFVVPLVAGAAALAAAREAARRSGGRPAAAV